MTDDCTEAHTANIARPTEVIGAAEATVDAELSLYLSIVGTQVG